MNRFLLLQQQVLNNNPQPYGRRNEPHPRKLPNQVSTQLTHDNLIEVLKWVRRKEESWKKEARSQWEQEKGQAQTKLITGIARQVLGEYNGSRQGKHPAIALNRNDKWYLERYIKENLLPSDLHTSSPAYSTVDKVLLNKDFKRVTRYGDHSTKEKFAYYKYHGMIFEVNSSYRPLPWNSKDITKDIVAIVDALGKGKATDAVKSADIYHFINTYVTNNEDKDTTKYDLTFCYQFGDGAMYFHRHATQRGSITTFGTGAGWAIMPSKYSYQLSHRDYDNMVTTWADQYHTASTPSSAPDPTSEIKHEPSAPITIPQSKHLLPGFFTAALPPLKNRDKQHLGVTTTRLSRYHYQTNYQTSGWRWEFKFNLNLESMKSIMVGNANVWSNATDTKGQWRKQVDAIWQTPEVRNLLKESKLSMYEECLTALESGGWEVPFTKANVFQTTLRRADGKGSKYKFKVTKAGKILWISLLGAVFRTITDENSSGHELYNAMRRNVQNFPWWHE